MYLKLKILCLSLIILLVRFELARCVPSEFNVFLKLYTKENMKGEPILLSKPNQIWDTTQTFCGTNPDSCNTFLIIHGYKSSSNASWVLRMKDELFEREENINVFIVDWSAGSDLSLAKYPQAVENIMTAYTKLNDYMQNLITRSYVRQNETEQVVNVHCIGHSLGAHTCGLLSKKLFQSDLKLRFERISGLDPAGPCFETNAPNDRLDRNDAVFVDVIHTSKLFGLRKSIGHVDFFPNDGTKQPDCWNLFSREESTQRKTITEFWCGKIEFELEDSTDDRKASVCSHSRAYEYFIESINSQCKFESIQCSNWKNYVNGLCGECDTNVMGMNVAPVNSSSIYFLKTDLNEPYCLGSNHREQAQTSYEFLRIVARTSSLRTDNPIDDVCLYSSSSRTRLSIIYLFLVGLISLLALKFVS